MKLINRDTDYAVRALLSISRRRDEKVSVSDLTERLGIPWPFLRKILQVLNKEGVLKSHKGKGGGFRLALPPDQIFLTDLIQIFQGPVKLTECIFKKKVCPDIKTCPLRKKMGELEKQMVSELQSITLASLLEKQAS